jgi:hypothetical protein
MKPWCVSSAGLQVWEIPLSAEKKGFARDDFPAMTPREKDDDARTVDDGSGAGKTGKRLRQVVTE